jgi:hypothetical protein
LTARPNCGQPDPLTLRGGAHSGKNFNQIGLYRLMDKRW